MAVYLAYTGMQDMFLTDQPEFTHFKTVYSRDLENTTKIVEQPFDQTSYNPGDTLISTLRQNGDYLSGVSLKIVLPKLTPDNVTSWVWYTNPTLGEFVYGFDTSGTQVFTVNLNSRRPSTNTSTWYTVSPGLTLTFQNNKTRFNYSSSISYIVFSTYETARLFGFVNDPIQLFSGYLRFNVNTTNPVSQVTFAECGWLQGDSTLSGLSSYTDDICYKLINSVSLYIGKQLIQEFDSNIIKIKKDLDLSYKNRPILKLLEGNTSVVDFNRVYYFDIPFIHVPVYSIPRHDIQIRVETNPLTNLSNFYASLVISFNLFADTTKLPKKYMIPFTQIQYFGGTNNIDIRGPTKTMYTTGDPNFEFKLNGERFFGPEKTIIDPYESEFTNVPRTSNVVVFDGPLNMSRIRDQNWSSSNTNVYAETINVLAIENDMAGILFDYTSVRGGYRKVTTNAIVPQPVVPLDTFYLFDYIPASASNVVAMYSMRRTNIYYTGPIVRLRNKNTGEELDFYTDSSQSYLRSLSNVNASSWVNPDVTIWYDQSGNNQNFYGGATCPDLRVQNGKYCIYFDNDLSGGNEWCKFFMNMVDTFYFYQVSMIVYPNSFFAGEAYVEPRGPVIYDSTGTYSTYFKFFSDTPPSKTNGSITSNPYFDYMSINNIINSRAVTAPKWYTVTSTSSFKGGPLVTLGVSQSIVASGGFNGYMFELGFYGGSTFSTTGESESYYARRPSGF